MVSPGTATRVGTTGSIVKQRFCWAFCSTVRTHGSTNGSHGILTFPWSLSVAFFHSVGTVFFSALSISIALIALHGAFREPDNLFIDEGEVSRGPLHCTGSCLVADRGRQGATCRPAGQLCSLNLACTNLCA